MKSLARGLFRDDGETRLWDNDQARSEASCNHEEEECLSATSHSSFPHFKGEATPAFSTLADLFQDCVIKASDGDNIDDMQIETLLTACWSFENRMRSYGLTNVANDFRQNIQKVRAVLDTAPQQQHTLMSLLAYEKSTGCHDHSGRIQDPSAAMGLLWIRRNIALQYRSYFYMFGGSADTMAPPEAALAAYHSELEPYLRSLVLRKLIALHLRCTTPRSRQLLLAK